MKKERITVELDPELKKRFFAVLEQNNQTASKVLRFKIQQYILLHEPKQEGHTHDKSRSSTL